MLKGFGRGQPGARGVDGGMGVVLWWKKRQVAKEFAAARGGGSGVVLYRTNGGTEVRRAGQAFFFLPAFDLRLVGMMRSAKGRRGKKQKNTLGLF